MRVVQAFSLRPETLDSLKKTAEVLDISASRLVDKAVSKYIKELQEEHAEGDQK